MEWSMFVLATVLVLALFGTAPVSSSAPFGNRVRLYSGPAYRHTMWQTAEATKTLAGLASYKRRHLYLRYPDREPTVCFNEQHLRNGTYGYFICPEADQPDSHIHCCGHYGEEKCCAYQEFQTYRSMGTLAGALLGGILVGSALVILACHCFCKKRRAMKAKSREVKVKYLANNTRRSRKRGYDNKAVTDDASRPSVDLGIWFQATADETPAVGVKSAGKSESRKLKTMSNNLYGTKVSTHEPRASSSTV